ncbi:MAG: zinc ABC transporter substrate-binding protein [Trueperaceae bacterium]|nr:MAG: zinc ABC transporter substrate-binding protein [Trueperaceae bacterium]
MRTGSHLMPLSWRLGVSLTSVLVVLALLAGSVHARPSVVVSIHPLFDIVRDIAGEHADVVRVLPPGASPHTFDPTPRDVGRIARADLVVFNGALDLWLRELVEASGSRAPLVEAIADARVQEVLRETFPDLVAVDAGGAVVGFNPHVWLDPLVMREVATLVAEALTDVAPEHADDFAAAAERVRGELLELDAELRETLAPVAGAAFVPFHDAWPYFAARYGLDLIVEIEPFPGREPSPAYLRYALDKIRASGAKAVFSEVQLNRRPAEVVADEAGVELFELDPLGGLDGRDSYASLLRANAAVILQGLR